MVVAITAVFSIAVFAIPAGLLSWGFETVGERFQAQRKAAKKLKRALNPDKNSDSDEDTFTLSSSEEDEDKPAQNRPVDLILFDSCPTCGQKIHQT